MANIFDEPIYLAPTATAISVGVTIVLWLFNTRDKKLSLEILSDTPLVTSSEEMVEHVHIFSAAGGEVKNVRLVEARLVNAGHVPIRVADYAEKISLEFADGDVLSAHIIESEPESLANNIKNGVALVEEVRPKAIVFKPVLLNPGNYFVVKVFVCGSTSSPVLKGHVEGIKQFQEFKESKLPKGLLVHAGAFIMIGAVYCFDPRSLVDGPLVSWVPNVVFFMLGYLMLLASFYDQKKRARWTKS
jgi:hypothetical protein